MKKYSQKRKSSTSPSRPLRVLITAGPTREFFDPVRFLSNPSSGKMGYALAAEAVRRDARVTLVSGPTSLKPPPRCRFIPVVSAAQMHRAVMKAFPKSDLVFMTAAVSDFTPASFSRHKVKKNRAAWTLRLKPTRDILKELGRKRKKRMLLVGFAAETRDVQRHALEKLKRKNLDLIVSNDVGSKTSGFQSDYNEATLWRRDGGRRHLKRMLKTKMAAAIFKTACSLFYRKSATAGKTPGL